METNREIVKWFKKWYAKKVKLLRIANWIDWFAFVFHVSACFALVYDASGRFGFSGYYLLIFLLPVSVLLDNAKLTAKNKTTTPTTK